MMRRNIMSSSRFNLVVIPESLLRFLRRNRRAGMKLRNLITGFTTKTTVDTGSSEVALSIDGLSLLEFAYSKIPSWRNRFLVFRDLKKIDCQQTSDLTCYRVFALFHPSKLRPEKFSGTPEEIGMDLANLIVRATVRNAGDLWRTSTKNSSASPPYLLETSLPVSMSALKATAQGVAILRNGSSDSHCRSVTKNDCINLAVKQFDVAFKRSGGRGKKPNCGNWTCAYLAPPCACGC